MMLTSYSSPLNIFESITPLIFAPSYGTTIKSSGLNTTSTSSFFENPVYVVLNEAPSNDKNDSEEVDN